MASILFKQFLEIIQRKKLKVLENVKRSRTWFRKKAMQMVSASARDVFGPDGMAGKIKRHNRLSNNEIGQLVMFFYDPKYKDTLPYYDKFPLVLYLHPKPGKDGPGFLGLNLHYLHPIDRAKLLDMLYTVAEKNKNNEIKRIKASYILLRDTVNRMKNRKFAGYEACIKHYLYSHVRSKFMVVNQEEWDMVCFLPLERFEKATREQVWADSKKKYK